ncbi:Prolipoprotein diacylglyceryl transferase [bioreactor metagenome]|uniref:Prolipoprotein diacylglyceryl transferase n=1 Tax=bioreactor metagenome TaxID=1076179 RepID=A0A644ZA31_9ZZZZ|nr:prolipoprotein diacylglyceryl transferase [Christensenella sp.]
MGRFAVTNLFGIQGFNIAWYGVIIASGMVLGILLASFRAKKRGWSADVVLDFLLLAVPLAVVGARLYYVAFEWENYSNNLLKIFAVNEGGLAIYGAVIGGFLAAFLFSRAVKFPFFKLIDLVIPSLILGQAIGRWGNFINQEAFGALVANPKFQFFPLAVYIQSLGEWHQATFFYESFCNGVLLIITLLLGRRGVKDGTLLAAYFIGYGIVRTIIEGLRTDSLYLFGTVRVSQLLSVLLAIVGVLLLILIKTDRLKTKSYSGKYCVILPEDEDNAN